MDYSKMTDEELYDMAIKKGIDTIELLVHTPNYEIYRVFFPGFGAKELKIKRGRE